MQITFFLNGYASVRKTVDAPPFLDEDDDKPPPKVAARSASPAAPAAPATVPIDPSAQEHVCLIGFLDAF